MPFLGQQPVEGYKTTAKQTITGDGSTSYTLDNAVTSGTDLEVFVNSVRQEPGTDYSASGNTITFTTAVESSDSCWLVYQGRASTTTTVGTDNIADSAITAGKIADGSVTAAKLAPGAGMPDAIDVNASAPADSLLINSSGNVGVGAANHKTWQGSWDAIQVGDYGTTLAGFNAGGGITELNHNSYKNGTSNVDTSIGAWNSRKLYMDGNTFTIYRGTSSGADQAITWENQLIIDSGGRIRMPYQPVAYITALSASPGADMTGGTVRTQRGGMSWNSTNGRLTVPVDGVYHIEATAFNNATSSALMIQLSSNGGLLPNSEGFSSTGTGWQYGTAYVRAEYYLSANDYIQVFVNSQTSSVYPGGGGNQLSAYLIG